MKKFHIYAVSFIVTAAAALIIASCSNRVKIPAEAVTLLEKSRYKTNDFINGAYSGFCTKNKQLAYYFLKSRLKTPELSIVLHEVKTGENFWGIAKEYGVDIDTVVGTNPDLTKLSANKGQILIILGKKGVIHEINCEKNYACLAGLYNANAMEIQKANSGAWFKKGSVLFIPGGKPKVFNTEMASYYEKRSLFKSPICGNGYSSLVGMRNHPIQLGVTKFHNGVDIRAKTGTWVSSAAEGTIICAGWINGYGKTIKIQHENGYVTMYAHLSEIHVKNGQKVAAGKLIGKSGSTGHFTGPRLHFSIFKDGKVMNPLDYIW
ncbi:MAG TPA: LysM peptidoglycan-binding domain-containing protein [Firmicutes bacterium]|nr:LysM peptidoglycan-binding domain-containing protein [Bacillota bacterium]